MFFGEVHKEIDRNREELANLSLDNPIWLYYPPLEDDEELEKSAVCCQTETLSGKHQITAYRTSTFLQGSSLRCFCMLLPSKSVGQNRVKKSSLQRRLAGPLQAHCCKCHISSSKNDLREKNRKKKDEKLFPSAAARLMRPIQRQLKRHYP